MIKKGKSELALNPQSGSISSVLLLPSKKKEKISLELVRRTSKAELEPKESKSKKLQKLEILELSKQVKDFEDNPLSHLESKEAKQKTTAQILDLNTKLKEQDSQRNEETAAMKYLSLVMQNNEKKQFQQFVVLQRAALELQQKNNYSETIKIFENNKKNESEFYADYHKKMILPIKEEVKADYLKSISEKNIKNEMFVDLKNSKNSKDREIQMKILIDKGIKEESLKLLKKIEEEKQKKEKQLIVLRNSLETQVSLKNQIREKLQANEKVLGKSIKKYSNEKDFYQKLKSKASKKLYISELATSSNKSHNRIFRKINTIDSSEAKSPYFPEDKKIRYPSSGSRFLVKISESSGNISPKSSRFL